ncbi:MAG: hypothetical protein K0S93_554 [Nitrososphaeraceae archaeon]|nr:hypothetical protein [Nitrososphaeraceae archaeon]
MVSLKTFLIFILVLFISSFTVDVNADIVLRDIDRKNDIIESKVDDSVNKASESRITIDNTTKCSSNLILSDIISANVVIGERFINSTLWFSNPFLVNYPENVAGVTYAMSIVDNSEVGLPLYTLALSWSPSYGWQKTLYQHSLSNNSSRPLTPNTNYPSILYGNVSNMEYGEDFGYVDIILDKTSRINLPNDYNILFHSLIFDDEFCYKVDLFDKIFDVPFLDSLLNSSEQIDLRPGQEKTVEIRVQSTPGSKPVINFLNVNQSADLYLHFPQSKVQSNSDGIAFTLAKLKTSPDIEPHIYTIPIHYNVTTKSFVAYPLMFKNARVIQIGEIEPRENLDWLTINILPALTTTERIDNFLKIYGGIISLIVISILTTAAVIGAGSALRYSNRKIR